MAGTSWRIGLLPLLAGAGLLITASSLFACRHPDDQTITYVNNTAYVLSIRADGKPFSPDRPVPPGASIRIGDNLNTWKNGARVQAYDGQGVLRFDRVITLEEIKRSDFKVIIE